MKSNGEKFHEICGVLFGLTLFYFWIFLISFTKFILFSETTVVSGNEITSIPPENQVDQWLTSGLLLFFLFFGHYLVYSRSFGGNVKRCDIFFMKSALTGFLLWLLVTVITSSLDIFLPYHVNVAGGYLIILIVYLTGDRPFGKRESCQSQK